MLMVVVFWFGETAGDGVRGLEVLDFGALGVAVAFFLFFLAAAVGFAAAAFLPPLVPGLAFLVAGLFLPPSLGAEVAVEAVFSPLFLLPEVLVAVSLPELGVVFAIFLGVVFGEGLREGLLAGLRLVFFVLRSLRKSSCWRYSMGFLTRGWGFMVALISARVGEWMVWLGGLVEICGRGCGDWNYEQQPGGFMA